MNNETDIYGMRSASAPEPQYATVARIRKRAPSTHGNLHGRQTSSNGGLKSSLVNYAINYNGNHNSAYSTRVDYHCLKNSAGESTFTSAVTNYNSDYGYSSDHSRYPHSLTPDGMTPQGTGVYNYDYYNAPYCNTMIDGALSGVCEPVMYKKGVTSYVTRTPAGETIEFSLTLHDVKLIEDGIADIEGAFLAGTGLDKIEDVSSIVYGENNSSTEKNSLMCRMAEFRNRYIYQSSPQLDEYILPNQKVLPKKIPCQLENLSRTNQGITPFSQSMIESHNGKSLGSGVVEFNNESDAKAYIDSLCSRLQF